MAALSDKRWGYELRPNPPVPLSQDQARSLKGLLQRYVKNIAVFLDVDNLEERLPRVAARRCRLMTPSRVRCRTSRAWKST